MRLEITRGGSAQRGLVHGQWVALAVGPGGEPAHALDLGLRRGDRPAELEDLLHSGVDRVDRDVVPDRLAGRLAALAEAAAELARAGRIEVVALEPGHLPEFPPEHPRIEAPGPLLVVVWDLDVVELAVRHAVPPCRRRV